MQTDANRLRQQLCALADLARTPDGICRLVYSESFWKSNEYIAQLMRQAGMTVRTNAVGNVVGTYPGKTDRRIVMGSHIDSVFNGGMFDGCLGVIGAIEVVRTLHTQGWTPNHTLDVVAFAEEEGIAVAGLLGSRAYCGLPPTPVMMEKMGSFGVTAADFAAAKAEAPLDAALELHIEQGGVLESRGVNIGVVRAIVALKRYLVEFSGVPNHAGTTPMGLRDDALIKAARFIQRVRQVVLDTDAEMVGTVGRVEVSPNAMNTIPGTVRLTLELRALEETSIATAYQTLMEEFASEIHRCTLTMEQPCFAMDPGVRASIHSACRTLGLSALDMGSGAGHDSMSLAQVTKTGMVFVPSIGGISHSPAENTAWQDVKRGADVLLQTLCLLDEGVPDNKERGETG